MAFVNTLVSTLWTMFSFHGTHFLGIVPPGTTSPTRVFRRNYSMTSQHRTSYSSQSVRVHLSSSPNLFPWVHFPYRTRFQDSALLWLRNLFDLLDSGSPDLFFRLYHVPYTPCVTIFSSFYSPIFSDSVPRPYLLLFRLGRENQMYAVSVQGKGEELCVTFLRLQSTWYRREDSIFLSKVGVKDLKVPLTQDTVHTGETSVW